MSRCDFCNSTKPVACFKTRPGVFFVELPTRKLVKLETNEHWSACGACKTLIDVGDKAALAKRAKAEQSSIFPLEFYAAIHTTLFWNAGAHYHGPAHD